MVFVTCSLVNTVMKPNGLPKCYPSRMVTQPGLWCPRSVSDLSKLTGRESSRGSSMTQEPYPFNFGFVSDLLDYYTPYPLWRRLPQPQVGSPSCLLTSAVYCETGLPPRAIYSRTMASKKEIVLVPDTEPRKVPLRVVGFYLKCRA